MAWTAPMTATTNTALSAANFNLHVRDNLNQTEAAVADPAPRGKLLISTGANAVTWRTVWRDRRLEPEGTSSTTYTILDDDGVGPAITVRTGTTAVAWHACEMSNGTANAPSRTSISVSGASSVAASDAWCTLHDGRTAGNSTRFSSCHRFTGLTAGVNTFTMEYRVGSGTGTFRNRELVVAAL